VGCAPTGPQGLNAGSQQIAADGQDLGDPEATELGAGHAGGNGSPYDDGLYHEAPGHCPAASTLGTVEVSTPLLPEGPGGAAPLTGHVYLAEPRCGGASWPACTQASATNGQLYSLYLEAAGSGVIIKLPGTASADPQTGQLTAMLAPHRRAQRKPRGLLNAARLRRARASLASTVTRERTRRCPRSFPVKSNVERMLARIRSGLIPPSHLVNAKSEAAGLGPRPDCRGPGCMKSMSS